MNWTVVLILGMMSAVTARGQKVYGVTTASDEINPDGLLLERTWHEAPVSSGFKQKFPTDSAEAIWSTEVRLAYDNDFIYIAAVCITSPADEKQVTTLYRDFPFAQNDAFAVLLNPFNDKLMGFSFEVTPFNSQGERLISNGGNNESGIDPGWDNKWYSGTSLTDSSWVVEIAIPFKTLRYKQEVTRWGINFVRNNLASNEISVWNPVPINLPWEALNYCGTLSFDRKTLPQMSNYSIIPSTTVSLRQDFEDSNQGLEAIFTPSLDAKIGVTTALNVDATLNPDFSQIDVDRQQLNIGRFELSFPERRQFFIENSDLFASYGDPNVRPFFSRRIGIVRNGQGLFENGPVAGGLRLTGKLGKRTRLGVMSVQTRDTEVDGDIDGESVKVQGRNYTIGSFQQQVLRQSTLSALVINSQELGNTPDFSRVAGAQANFISNDNQWQGQMFLFHHYDTATHANAYGASIGRNSRNYGFSLGLTRIDEEFNPQAGFVPRGGIDFITFAPYLLLYPKNEKINRIDVFFDSNYTLNLRGTLLDASAFNGTFWLFKNTSSALFAINHIYTRLNAPFDPSNNDGLELESGSDFYYPRLVGRYQSDARKLMTFRLQAEHGRYFNGKITSMSGFINLRLQPHLLAGIDFTLNKIDLPSPFSDNLLALISPSARISVTNRLFITYISQYNTLQKNIGTNVRLQWRFRPVSDLFIVYTDNYTDNFVLRNQTFSLKFVYWI